MNDQNAGYTRLHHTATGALAALALVGVIAAASALAAKPPANTHAAAVKDPTKTPAPPVAGPGKTRTSQPSSHAPFLTAIQRLVDAGKITATEGQAVDREIRAGQVDTGTLASSGFTQTQIQAVDQALENAKRALAPAVTGVPRTPRKLPPARTCAPGGGKEPSPAASGTKSTPK